MKVNELIIWLCNQNPNAEVKIGMFFGPGSPTVECFLIERLMPGRVLDEVIITANDYSRRPSEKADT